MNMAKCGFRSVKLAVSTYVFLFYITQQTSPCIWEIEKTMWICEILRHGDKECWDLFRKDLLSRKRNETRDGGCYEVKWGFSFLSFCFFFKLKIVESLS